MERLGIAALAKRHIRALSGGQQQRVFLGRALFSNPKLLLLDEPTSGVDIKTRDDILHLLDELNHDGVTVVMTTHELNAVAAHLPWVICVNHAVIAEGAPSDVYTPEILRRTYNAEMNVIIHEGMTLVAETPAPDRQVQPQAQDNPMMLEPLQYEFFVRALIAATIVGGLCGMIGVYVVLRKMSYIGHGLSHAIFGGAVVSFVMGFNFYIGASLWGFGSALLINLMTRRRKYIAADAAIGIITTASFALGIALISRYRTFTRSFDAALFGNILGVDQSDIIAIIAVTVMSTVAVVFLYRRLLFATFDPEVAPCVRSEHSVDRHDVLADPRRIDRRLAADPGRDADRRRAGDPADHGAVGHGPLRPDDGDLGGRRIGVRVRRACMSATTSTSRRERRSC